MDVSIVIPNYNGEKLLAKNLPKVINSVEEYKKGNVEIILVDDGSNDLSLEVIEKEKLKLKANESLMKVVVHEKNQGFSSTVNDGVKNAAGDIVVLLNTDAVPQKGFLEKVVTHFSDNRVFAVGFAEQSVESDSIVMRGRGIGSWRRGFPIHSKGENNKDNTLWASGGSSAFRKDIWKKIGGMLEVYNPFYYEDMDLSYRALKLGYLINFDNSIIVRHEHEKGAIRTHYSSFKVRSVSSRNQLFFVWLNITDSSYLLEHILWLPYHFMNTLRKDRDLAFAYGFFMAILKMPEIVTRRALITRSFKKTDREIFSSFAV